MTEDGVGIFGSKVAGSTKGWLADGLSATCPMPTFECTHNKRKIRPTSRLLADGNRRRGGCERDCIELDFIARPVRKETRDERDFQSVGESMRGHRRTNVQFR